MRKFIALLAIISIVNCQSSPSTTGAGDILNCALSMKGVVDEVKGFVKLLNSTVSTGDLVYEYTIFAGKVMGALRDCNLNISFKIMPASPEACINDIKGIYTLATQIIAEKDSKDYAQLLRDIISLVQDIQQAIPDCSGKQIKFTNVNLTECGMDVESFGSDIFVIYDDLKDGSINYTLFLNKTLSIMKDLPSSLEHCGLPQYSNVFGDISKSLGTEKCQSDITSSISFIENAKKAYASMDYVSVVHQLSGLYIKGKLIATDCLNINVGYFLNQALDLARRINTKDITELQTKREAFLLLKAYDRLEIVTPTRYLRTDVNAPSCAAAVLALIPEAEKLLEDYKSGSYSKILEELPAIAKLLSDLVAQCK